MNITNINLMEMRNLPSGCDCDVAPLGLSYVDENSRHYDDKIIPILNQYANGNYSSKNDKNNTFNQHIIKTLFDDLNNIMQSSQESNESDFSFSFL